MTQKAKGLEDSRELYQGAYIIKIKELQAICGLLRKVYSECDEIQEEFTRGQRGLHQTGKRRVLSLDAELRRQLS